MDLAVYEPTWGSPYNSARPPFKSISLVNSNSQYILTHSKYSLHYIIQDFKNFFGPVKTYDSCNIFLAPKLQGKVISHFE